MLFLRGCFVIFTVLAPVVVHTYCVDVHIPNV